MPQHTMILDRLTTGYRKKAVTTDISATLEAGRLTCLLGPNGAGKSTLLKTMCRFIPPVSGDIVIDGESITTMSARRVSRTISVVLTERVAAINMTAEQLVGLGRSPYTSFFGSLSDRDREIIDKVIAQLGIDRLRNRNINTLSDGERQKVFIAKALAQQTPVIMLDEPTAFLDFPSKVDIMRLLCRIAHDESKTVFLTTHDVELAIMLSDYIWLLDKTLGLTVGTSKDLAANGSLAEYFDRPGLVFNRATMHFDISGSVSNI